MDVSGVFFFLQPSASLRLVFIWSLAVKGPIHWAFLTLPVAGGGGSGAPVRAEHAGAAHAQRAAAAGLLQLHVRTCLTACWRTSAGSITVCVCVCVSPPSPLHLHQDEAAEGVWRGHAQHRLGHHQTPVVPQLRTQDSRAVSSHVCVCVGSFLHVLVFV